MLNILQMGQRMLLGLVLLAGLGACAAPTVGTGTHDPNEDMNRSFHAFNRGLDKVILRPTSNVYGQIVPEPVQQGVSNVASNLNAPGDAVNNILQFRVADLTHNTTRFLINSTVGVFGIFDVATPMGIEARPTDFGETLYYWRVKEGAYVELPVVGPGTARHTAGRFVDLAINPVSVLVPAPENAIGTAVGIADVFGARYRNSDLIDTILYESADSYAQARVLYLQNRRFKLGGTGADATYLDPYEDPYGPYED